MRYKVILVFLLCFFLMVSFESKLVRAQDKVLADPGLTKLIMENPETINRFLLDAIKQNSPLKKLIDSINIKMKMFDPVNNSEGSSLGFSYDLSKDIAKHSFSVSKKHVYSGLAFNFSSNGDVVFDPAVNPDNLISADLSFLFFQSSGGAVTTTDEVAYQLNELEDRAAEAKTIEELSKDKAVLKAIQIIRSHLSTQFYWEVSFDGGMETNQSLTMKQYFYGGHLGLDIKAWNPESALAQFNFFDYPFALSRYLTGTDKNWRPRGSCLPILLVGIDHVNPRNYDLRSALDNKSEFDRFRFESSYRTLAAMIGDSPIYFEADLRYYREFDAVGSVKKESLSSYSYWSVALLFPHGVYIAYSRGKLPLNVQNEQVYSAGISYSF